MRKKDSGRAGMAEFIAERAPAGGGFGVNCPARARAVV